MVVATLSAARYVRTHYLKALEAIEQTQRADHSQHTNEAQHLYIRNKRRDNEVEGTDYDDEQIKSVPWILPIAKVTC